MSLNNPKKWQNKRSNSQRYCSCTYPIPLFSIAKYTNNKIIFFNHHTQQNHNHENIHDHVEAEVIRSPSSIFISFNQFG